MVVRTAVAYANNQLANGVKTLHQVLNQAEIIVNTLATENQRLKDALANLASENNQCYILHNENFNEPVLTI